MPKVTLDWLLFKHKETGEFRCISSTEELDGMRVRTDASTVKQREWERIGNMAHREDVDFFVAQRELGMPSDALAYLQVEHALRVTPTDLTDTMRECLLAKIATVQKETDRCCFGHCHSMEGSPACLLCYTQKRPTWFMCANLRCLQEEGKLVVPKPKKASLGLGLNHDA